jgi:hypothetical protein
VPDECGVVGGYEDNCFDFEKVDIGLLVVLDRDRLPCLVLEDFISLQSCFLDDVIWWSFLAILDFDADAD